MAFRIFPLLLILPCVLLAQGTPISFEAPRNYSGGGTDFALADLNGDGLLDILSVDGTNVLHIHLGTGNGLFAADSGGPVLSGDVNAIVASDLNGDGFVDLAVGSSSAKQIAIYFGDGALGFHLSATYAVSTDPVFLKLTFLNLDHYQDIVSVGNAGVSVLMGSPNGQFQPARTVTTGPTVPAIAIADFNGDGKLDLVVSIPHALEFFAGQGGGSFSAPLTFADIQQDEFTALEAADLNGDGKMDLVMEWPGIASVLGNGDGTFGPVIYSATYFSDSYNINASRIAVADLNGDGKLDAVIPGAGVLLGRGDGRFYGGGTYNTGTYSAQVALAHIHSSKYLDIVSNGHELTVLLNNGNGTFHVPPVTNRIAGSPLNEIFSMAVADFNLDGHDDLLYEGEAMFLGTGNAASPFRPLSTFNVPCRAVVASYATAGDFNGDGKPDILTNCGSYSLFQAGNGDGTFQPGGPRLTLNNNYPPVTGDFNGDGKLDFAYSTASGAFVAYGNGDGTFGVPVVIDASPQTGLLTNDLNGDGKPDLIVWDSVNATVLLNGGNGNFSPALIPNIGTSVIVLIGDVTGDGIPDLVAVNFDNVIVVDGLGGGVFDTISTLVVLETAYSPVVAAALTEVNGDQAPDLVLVFNGADGITGQIQVIESKNGTLDLSLADPILYSSPGTPKQLAIGYFQAQSPLSGYPDLAVSGQYTEHDGAYGFELMLNNSAKK